MPRRVYRRQWPQVKVKEARGEGAAGAPRYPPTTRLKRSCGPPAGSHGRFSCRRSMTSCTSSQTLRFSAGFRRR
jgi:hypothetical protein